MKLILIGKAATGKTSIVNRFVENTFEEDGLTTIGVDLKSMTLMIEDTPVRCQIWDTAGQEQFSSLTRQYFQGCHGVIAVFDLCESDSLFYLSD